MSRLEDKRRAAKALTPWRDQIADKIKWFFIKLLLAAAVIIIICAISYGSSKGN